MSSGAVSESTRTVAAGLLVAAWVTAVVASQFGSFAHSFAVNLVTALLLWRIWRGAGWSRNLLIVLSCVSAGFVVGLMVGVLLGAAGINTSVLVMFVLYAGVGSLLCAPPVRALVRPPRSVTA